MRRAWWLVIVPALLQAQNIQDVLKQGEEVFSKGCSVGYCHGPKGAGGGAPRLAARGFDQAYINNTVSSGVSGTAMPAFAKTLSRPDLAAVVAYIASLNGIGNPNIAGAGGRGIATQEQPLPPDAARRPRVVLGCRAWLRPLLHLSRSQRHRDPGDHADSSGSGQRSGSAGVGDTASRHRIGGW